MLRVRGRQAVVIEDHARREADRALDMFVRRLEKIAQDWGGTTAAVSAPSMSEESKRDSRLEIELDLNRKGVDHEVVLLEAASKDELRRTHRRYFGDFSQIQKAGIAQDE